MLESAIANAEHNDGADIDELKVKTIYVEQGATLKRFTARAKGRGNRIMQAHLPHLRRPSATERIRNDHGTENSSDRLPPCGHPQLELEVVREQASNFADMLAEDIKVREFLKKKLSTRRSAAILIERPAKNARITIYTRASGRGDRQEGRGHRERCKATLRKLTGRAGRTSTSRKSASPSSMRS